MSQDKTDQVPQEFSNYIHIRKIILGIETIQSKEDAATLYNAIINGQLDVNKLSKETQSTLKKYLDENGGSLSLAPEQKIDWSQYGIDTKIAETKKEQDKQIADQKIKESEQKQLSLVQEKNSFNYQNQYHLDNTVLIGIGMVCITILIIVVLMLFKRKIK